MSLEERLAEIEARAERASLIGDSMLRRMARIRLIDDIPALVAALRVAVHGLNNARGCLAFGADSDPMVAHSYVTEALREIEEALNGKAD